MIVYCGNRNNALSSLNLTDVRNFISLHFTVKRLTKCNLTMAKKSRKVFLKTRLPNLGKAVLIRKLPICYNGAPTFVSKLPFPVDRSTNQTVCLISGHIRHTIPNRMYI